MEVPMEEKSLDGNGNSSSSRWNPTKEQITMLESLYKQGIRTPSAEQIQQITGRLKAFGHIEGKNVFYWFQNHKARQRQKQKQESMVYFNPFFHNPTPVFTPTAPSNNVVCSPYYIPQTGMGYYPQYPKLPLPSNVFKRRSRVEKFNNVIGGGAGHQHDYHPYMNNVNDQSTKGTPNSGETETLPLFPLHPTGILEHERSGGICSSMENSNTSNTTSDQSGGGGDIKECSANQPFFDFFAHHHGSE